MHHLDRARRGQHAPRIRAEDVRHHAGTRWDAGAWRERRGCPRAPPPPRARARSRCSRRRASSTCSRRSSSVASSAVNGPPPLMRAMLRRKRIESPSREEPIHSATSEWGGSQNRASSLWTTATPGSTSPPPTRPRTASRGWPAARSTRACSPRSAPSAGCSGPTSRACKEPVLVSSTDSVGHQDEGRHPGRRPRHRGPRHRQPLRERHPGAGRGAPVLPRLPGRREASTSTRWRRSCAAWPRPAPRSAAR